MRRLQLFNLGAYALVLGLGIAALALGGGARHVAANDFPPMPPGLVSASPPSGLTPGQGVSPSVTEQGAMRVVIDTPGGTDVDVTQPQPVIPYQSSSLTIAQVSCPSTAGGILLDRRQLQRPTEAADRFPTFPARRSYVGPPTVTTTTGFPIPTGNVAINPFPGYTGELDCIVATSSDTMTVSQQQ